MLALTAFAASPSGSLALATDGSRFAAREAPATSGTSRKGAARRERSELGRN
jgi:hypothetical protein